MRDGAQDRGRIVLRMVDQALFHVRRDEDGRHARARTPAVALRRRRVVIKAAVLIVGDDDQHVFPLRTFLQLGDDAGDVRVAVGHAGVARVLVQIALRLVEGHGRQLAGARVGQELAVEVAQVGGAVGGRLHGVHVGKVIERLVVELEVRRIREAAGARAGRGQGRRVLPGARIPGPVDVLAREQVADIRLRLRRQRIGLARVRIQFAAVARGGRVAARLERRLHGIDGVEHARAVGRRQRAVVGIGGRAVQDRAWRRGGWRQAHKVAVGVDVDLRDRAFRHRSVRVWIRGCARADQVLVREEGAAEGADEEVVGQRILLGDVPQLHLAAIVIAHRESARIGIRGELVVGAAVDLHLVVVEAVHEVARDHRLRQVQRAIGIVDLERLVGQVGRLRLRDDGALAGRRHAAPGGWQHGQGAAVDVFLWHIGGA
ncbi:hypothetical protein D3C85_711230 [compost metagenome]